MKIGEKFMDIFKFLADHHWIIQLLLSLLVILFSTLFYTFFENIIFDRIRESNKTFFSDKKFNTYLKMIKNISKYLFIMIVVVIILKINGINISSLLAGIGIIGIIIGFAIQDALKDIIKGFDIVSDSYYQVGDIIHFDTITGKVLSIGLKTTKVEDVYSSNIVSISNRNIEQVEVVSHLINIDIPLPYELKLKDAEEAVHYIVSKIQKDKEVEKVEYRGVNALGDSSILYQIKVYCSPDLKVQKRRDALRCIVEGLEEKKITIPYTQIDIHSK